MSVPESVSKFINDNLVVIILIICVWIVAHVIMTNAWGNNPPEGWKAKAYVPFRGSGW